MLDVYNDYLKYINAERESSVKGYLYQNHLLVRNLIKQATQL